jgi:hypothetical protein
MYNLTDACLLLLRYMYIYNVLRDSIPDILTRASFQHEGMYPLSIKRYNPNVLQCVFNTLRDILTDTINHIKPAGHTAMNLAHRLNLTS